MSRQGGVEQAGERRTGRGAGREQVRGIRVEPTGVSRAASRVAVGSRAGRGAGRGRRADRGQAGGRMYIEQAVGHRAGIRTG